jgi:hypothetical protein
MKIKVFYFFSKIKLNFFKNEQMNYFIELIQKVLVTLNFRKPEECLVNNPHTVNLVVSILCVICSKKF